MFNLSITYDIVYEFDILVSNTAYGCFFAKKNRPRVLSGALDESPKHGSRCTKQTSINPHQKKLHKQKPGED